jgi:hypothetical protein
VPEKNALPGQRLGARGQLRAIIMKARVRRKMGREEVSYLFTKGNLVGGQTKIHVLTLSCSPTWLKDSDARPNIPQPRIWRYATTLTSTRK